MLKLRKLTPTAALIIVAALAALLFTFGLLQYRWLHQLSDNVRERMRAELRAGVERFSQDFNREITRVFLSFQISASSRREAEAAYAERLARWAAAAPHPGLVAGIYSVTAGGEEGLRLYRFDHHTGRLEPSGWPNELAPLRRRLEQASRQPPPGAALETHAEGGKGIPDVVVEEVPAVVIENAPAAHAGRGEAPDEFGRRSRPGYTVVRLSLDYLTREFIPALVGRHLPGGGAEYDMAVVSNNGRGVIYQSGRGELADPSVAGDASAGLLSVSPGEVQNFLIVAAPAPSDASHRQALPGVSLRTKAPARHDIIPGGDTLSPAGGASLPAVLPAQMSGGGGASAAGEGRGPWQLKSRHAAGSLEAAAAGIRRWNLLTSFAVLLLLAASVVMSLVLAFRMQRFARRQMEFVAGVSHDLRTPVAVLYSAGENLADGTIDGRERVVQYGEIIRDQSYRLAEMVEQVMEFAGATSIEKAFKLRPVEVASVVEKAIACCEPQLREKGLSVESEIEPDLPRVLADEAALARALQNLLTNASKYGGGGGWIGLRARAGAHRRRAEVQITVADRGPGIEASELPDIFEPFRRGRAASESQTPGSGLGLCLVKRIAEAHGGKVSVRSVAGRGSAFTLHLPALITPT